MLVIISPAKTLDFISKIPNYQSSEIIFKKEVSELIENCRKLSEADLSTLMNISPKLAQLNFDRFKKFNSANNLMRPAIYAYDGDVYDGFTRNDYDQTDINFAQTHLRIISGLYGLLRPMDNIQEYRLEMSIHLKNNAGTSLYKFWQEKVTNQLNSDLKESGSKFIINLTSNEYSDVIDKNKLDGKIINVFFKENRNGQLKTIAINSKKARGVITNYIIKNKITRPSEFKGFTEANYNYDATLSNDNEYYFLK